MIDPKILGAYNNLRDHQRQLDMDGVEVGVSREALDVVLEYLNKTQKIDFIYKNRGTGRTTKQLKELPKGGLFIVAKNGKQNTVWLAEKLGRSDIVVRTFEECGFHGSFINPNNFSKIAFDHEVEEIYSDHPDLSIMKDRFKNYLVVKP